ncbi:hypothetical protein B0A48_08628 [Cryoendolithus antarcticus]|uniref:Uncharacterized protein n=1 Tax=Cryoendolithus antarcticus TaxID=1507870 RepID=A0A1V8T3X7_9PEZI|nr:hypothetical protein B0A48_08628 [Cryoendolithus antarcticus]
MSWNTWQSPSDDTEDPKNFTWYPLDHPSIKPPTQLDIIYDAKDNPTRWRHNHKWYHITTVPTTTHIIKSVDGTQWRRMNKNEVRRKGEKKTGQLEYEADYKNRHGHFPNQKAKFPDCKACNHEDAGKGLYVPEATNDVDDAKTGDPGKSNAADGSLQSNDDGMSANTSHESAGEASKGGDGVGGGRKNGGNGKGKGEGKESEDGGSARSLSPVKKALSVSAASSRIGSPAPSVKRDSVADRAATWKPSKKMAKESSSKDGSTGASKVPVAAKKPDGALAAAVEEGRRMEEDAVADNRDAKERRRIEQIEADHTSMMRDWNQTNEANQKLKDKLEENEKEMGRIRRENTDIKKRAEESEKAREQAEAIATQAEKDLGEVKRTASTTQTDLNKAKKDVNELKSELKDTAEALEEKIEAYNKAYDRNEVLQEQLQHVEDQAQALDAMTAQRDQLTETLSDYNEKLEVLLQGMAKDLTLEEKLKQVREQLEAKHSRSESRTPSERSLPSLPKRRPGAKRHVSLADELAGVGEDGNEDQDEQDDGEDQGAQDAQAPLHRPQSPQAAQPHLQVPPLQTLGFSGIISQETVPVPPRALKPQTLSFSNIISQETVPVQHQAPPKPALSLSAIISQAISPKKVKSSPKSDDLTPGATSAQAQTTGDARPPPPTYADALNSPFSSQQTSPTAQPQPQQTKTYVNKASSPITAEQAKDATLDQPQTKVIRIEGPTKYLEVVPRFDWLYWAIPIILGFVFLVGSYYAERERRVWADANDTSGAYDRMLYGMDGLATYALLPGKVAGAFR